MPTIIFDFDGTLTDVHTHFVDLAQMVNRVLKQNNLRTFTLKEFEQLRDMSSTQAYKTLDVPFYKAPFVIPKLIKQMNYQPQILPSLVPIIKKLVPTYQLGIVTSNSENVVRQTLSQHDLTGFFSFVIAGSRLFGKKRALKKALKQYRIDPDFVWYIGDETRDILAAQQAGIKIISVTWGLNTKKILAQFQPNYLIDEPQELQPIFNL